MSGPYDQYGQNQQYGQQYPPNGQYGQPSYSSPPPHGQGYPPPQQGYGQQYPPQQQGQGYYGGDQQQQQQQQYPGYGPPAHGGFQNGQPHDQYNQQQGAYGQQQQSYPGQAPAQQFPQQGGYPQDQYPQGQHPPQHGAPGQDFGPTDPNAQAEGDRGLMGALGGGAAGYFGGNKMGNHGVLGALAGAFLGHKAEDHFKDKKHKNNGHGGGW